MDKVKPTVVFTNGVQFDTDLFPGYEVAHVQTLDHPVWGSNRVRTSEVLKKFEDGSFETRNTLYVPYKEE